LKKYEVQIANIPDYAVEELKILLSVPTQRGNELLALAEFLAIPSIGIRFAENVLFLVCHPLTVVRIKDGDELPNENEREKRKSNSLFCSRPVPSGCRFL